MHYKEQKGIPINHFLRISVHYKEKKQNSKIPLIYKYQSKRFGEIIQKTVDIQTEKIITKKFLFGLRLIQNWYIDKNPTSILFTIIIFILTMY